jgi:hypothetical protein
MPTSEKPSDLKKTLLGHGFEIFRVQGLRVHLADRVRDNLIMDSGVAAEVVAEGFAVRFVVIAQATLFPGETPEQLFERARAMAAVALARGYSETEAVAVPVRDPGGSSETLDTWYEVAFEKPVEDGGLVNELRYALGLEKAAGTG